MCRTTNPEFLGHATVIYFFGDGVFICFCSLRKSTTIGELVAVIVSYVTLSTVAVQLWKRFATPCQYGGVLQRRECPDFDVGLGAFRPLCQRRRPESRFVVLNS